MSVGAVTADNFKIAVGDSGGEHSGTLFLNGKFGSEQDTVNEAAIGTVDMSILAINNVTPFSTTVGVLSLPYVILSLEDAEKLTQGPIGQELTENTVNDFGVRIIAWTYTGFRRLTNSKKPVTSVADLDGQDNPYTTNLRYIFSIEPLIVSEQVFQGLPEKDQAIVLEAGQRATQASAQFLRDKEAEIKEILIAEGMEIMDPENNEKEFIQLATEAVWPDFYDSIGGVEKLNAVLAEIGSEPVSE
ncbi:TRAP transporter substrate-binding protein [Yoonia sediminilitoris]|uniref:TRAP-type C4-dicarboxylate transport system substrate-binding protein n=1 Tax=Yoonia sediminilitoris TaxID=1286148 RepID=A0A2T6KLK7_9RHOB|nr:TRAP transporter substrate-binding protein [Yoonia sediminilitoris]PUB17086.1 TRAP-type C4-dicarboxylate transport system substrate-binding protein [Yoonia sediminilitoris]RCW97381.1 TRAP-type C4-dicarboxylate transport system substrate-binding protein [Yoonia sediminilitoris]